MENNYTKDGGGYGSISQALMAAQSKMSNAKKGSNNPYYNSRYADLNAVREAIIPHLLEAGLMVLQPIVHEEGRNFVKTIIVHGETGQTFESRCEILCTSPNDPQKFGSGVTYARRYGLQSLLCIGAEDDDGNAASGKDGARQAPQKAAPKPEPKKPAAKPSGKPVMREAQFRQALTRISGGELELRKKCLATFALTDAQKAMLEDAELEYRTNNSLI